MDMQSSAAMSSMGTMTMATSTGAMSSMMPTATATTTMSSSMDMDMGGSGACKISVSCLSKLLNYIHLDESRRADQNPFPILDVVELEHYRHL